MASIPLPAVLILKHCQEINQLLFPCLPNFYYSESHECEEVKKYLEEV